jgi:3-deoxy-D-manno-octulosonic-acid transferase
LPFDEAALTDLRAAVGKRPRWLAASIHPGEDVIVADAHHTAKAHHPGLLTIVVPRHPQRAAAMAADITARGMKVVQRSTGQAVGPDTDIYIADTMGELGLFYRLCDLVFIGKSLSVGGGQNPAEAAQLGCALLFGPDMSNFRDTARDFIACRAAVEVRNAAALAAAVNWLLQDTRTRERMAEAARVEMARHGDAISETLGLIAPYLGSLSAAPLSPEGVNPLD